VNDGISKPLPSTQKCYHAGQQCYIHFCTQLHLTPLPTSEHTLLLFVAQLALSGLAHTFIKVVYLSSIGNWHASCSLHDMYHIVLTPRLEQVLHGIRKEQARIRPKRVHLPITVHIMTKIYSVLEKSPTDYQSIMLWAACCAAFFGLGK